MAVSPALPLLARAGRGYGDLLPDEVRNARPRAAARIGGGSGMAELLPNREMLSAPATRSALLGGHPRNRWLAWGLAASVVLQALVLYAPPLQSRRSTYQPRRTSPCCPF